MPEVRAHVLLLLMFIIIIAGRCVVRKRTNLKRQQRHTYCKHPDEGMAEGLSIEESPYMLVRMAGGGLDQKGPPQSPKRHIAIGSMVFHWVWENGLLEEIPFLLLRI